MKQQSSFLYVTLGLLLLASTAQGQVASWGLNNTANDGVGTINGTIMNTPVYSTDRKEGTHALILNGSTQYVDLGTPTTLPAGTSPRTISAWAKTTTLSAYRWIFAYGSPATSNAMAIGMNGKTLVGTGFGGDLTVANFWTSNVWHHVCLTYDGTTAKLYADGVLVASAAKTWSLILSKAFIGLQVNAHEYWQGSIDDVRVYDVALTASEVLAIATIPPLAPTSFTAVASSSTTVTLAWTDASSDETGFQVERSLTSGSGYALISTTAANATTFADATVTGGVTYFYRIRSINTGGSSAYTPVASALTPQSLPLPPAALNATALSTSAIALSWTDGSTNETGFQLERSLLSGTGYSLIATLNPNANTYSDAGLVPDTRYFYRIRSINSDGNSPYTAEATTVTYPSAPLAPYGLSTTPKSSTSILLNWTDASTNETGFEIERSLTTGSGYTLIFTTVVDATSFMDYNLLPNTKYYYRIRAINSGGNSTYTLEVTITTPDPPPVAPSRVKAVANSSTSVDVSWLDKSNNETGFEIERSLNPDADFVLVSTTEANAVSFTDDRVTSGNTYYYRVRATNEGGKTIYTTVGSATLFLPGITQLCDNLFCNSSTGTVGVGTQIVPAGYKLAVKGKVMAEGVKVALQGDWPDYVFEDDHLLTDLPTLKKYIAEYGHLPNVPAAETVQQEGIDMAGINVVLLEKIEELSLYLIQMEERMQKLEAENLALKNKKK